MAKHWVNSILSGRRIHHWVNSMMSGRRMQETQKPRQYSVPSGIVLDNIGSISIISERSPLGVILYTYINRHAGTPEASKNRIGTM